MGFQFIHVESYARAAGKGKQGGHSIRSILAEAGREAGAHPHVEHPSPPILVRGIKLDELEECANDYAEHAKDSIGRKLRIDAPVMFAGVISAPPDFSAAHWDDLKTLSLEALRERFGDRLKTVVEHTDEARPHIHFYAVPLPGERFDQMHTGRGAKAAAEAEAKAQGLPKSAITKAGNVAYKAEMRAFQRWFHDRVGSRLGLTLMGPKRRRMSRAEWRAEQDAAEAIAKARTKADSAKVHAQAVIHQAMQANVAAEQAKDAAQQIQQQAQKDRQDADRKREEVLTQSVKVEGQRKKVNAAYQQVQAEKKSLEAEKAAWERFGRRVGVALGWVWDAITGTSRKLKRELEEHRRASEAHLEAVKKKANQDSKDAIQSAVTRVKTERDLLVQDVNHLRKKLNEHEMRSALKNGPSAHLRSHRGAFTPR